jgi:hypothetical protein
MSDHVYIFDTTLRDGEQSPGCSMTVPEKLRMAAKLVELGVDILEAGFPIASDGDFEAVSAVGAEFPTARVAALARCCTLDVERAAKSLERAARPRIHTFIATSEIHLKHKLKKTRQQVLDEAVAAVELARRYTDDVEFSAEDGARTDPDYLETVSKAVVAAGAGTVNIPDTVGYSTHRAGAGRRRHRERALPRRSGPGRGQLAGRYRSRGTPGGMHHQRNRRARRQLLAGGGGDDPQDPLRPVSLSHRHPYRTSLRGQPVAELADHLRPAAE